MQTLTYARSARGAHRLQRFSLISVLALALALITSLGVAAYHTPQAHASSRGAGPSIQWDQSMIYPGKNNPEGPVGEAVLVHGQNFTAGQQVKLVLVAGDSGSDATICQQTGVTVGHVTASSGGNFDATFAWPDQANQVNQAYSICGLQDGASTPTVLSSADGGPFTVLSANKPTFSVSATSVAAGGTLTVTGQNWVPAQALNITIASCADCDPGNNNIATAATTSIGRNTGTFSVNITIPATMAANNYVVNVTSQNGPLDANHIDGLGTRSLSVTAAVPTATPTTEPSPSVTASATQTVTASPTASTGASGAGNGSGNGVLIGVLIVLAIALVGIGGAIVFILVRRSKQQGNASDPASAGGAGGFRANQANQFNMPRTPVTPFPQSQQMNTPNAFGSSPNNNGAYSGFNQQGNWQGNPQNQGWQNNQQGNWQGNPQSQGWPGNPPDQSWQNNQQGNWQNGWQGHPQSNPGFNNFQQNQPFQPQQGFGSGPNMGGWSAPARQCVRCGNQLGPGDLVCGNCGTRNASADPNDPTVAY